MSDFTPEEFNEGIMKLSGWQWVKDGYVHTKTMQHERWAFDFWGDLNQLMPIAWKYGVHLTGYHDNSVFAQAKGWSIKSGIYQGEGKETKAIRQCLWQIYKEQK